MVNRVFKKYKIVAAASEPMLLKLGSAINPDTGEGSKITTKTITVTSFEEASKKTLKFIEDNNLGSGNWYNSPGAGSLTSNGKAVARVAYNGNVFAPDDKTLLYPEKSKGLA